MEKKVKGLIALSCLSVLAMGAIVGVAAGKESGLINNELPNIRAARTPVNFSEETITRRVYFYLDGSWADEGTKWDGCNFVLHYTLNGGTTWNWTGDATEFYGDFYNGLYYIDITAQGIGASFVAQVKSSNSDSSYCYTNEVTLPSLADEDHDVIHVESGNDGYGHRKASISAAGASEIGKIASFLNFMRPCIDSYANGYNAYPHFNANFLDPANAAEAIAASGNTQTGTDEDEEHVHYTVNQKIAELSKQYTKNGWIVS